MHVAHVIVVLLAHGDALEGIRRSKRDLFKALSVGREDDVTGHAVFAIGPIVVVKGLNREGLGIGVIVAFALELRFAFGKSLNDLLDGNGGRFVDNGVVAGRMEFVRRRGRVIGLLSQARPVEVGLRLWSRRRRPSR